MTPGELDRLAELIADALLATAPAAERGESRGSWLPTPVRPEPPRRGGEPPVWSGAAQELRDEDRSRGEPHARVSTAELTNVARAAAAGRGTAPSVAPKGRARFKRGAATREGLGITVPIGVSNRHLHLAAADARILFGTDSLTSHRALSQPGQFAARESVDVVTPAGRIQKVRVVGPARGATQLELSRSDARLLGIDPPVAGSGSLASSIGGVELVGPAGTLKLQRGVIIAARHLHLAPDDAARWGIRDGDFVEIRCGQGARQATFHEVWVRSGPAHATEFHLDADEAAAAGVKTGDAATIVRARSDSGNARRALVTERDVQAIARAGGQLPERALLTPSARDRARALGLLP